MRVRVFRSRATTDIFHFENFCFFLTTTLARKLARTEHVCEQIAVFELKFSFDDALVRVSFVRVFFVFVDNTYVRMFFSLV